MSRDFFRPTALVVVGVLLGGFLYGWLQAIVVAVTVTLVLTGLAYLDARCQ